MPETAEPTAAEPTAAELAAANRQAPADAPAPGPTRTSSESTPKDGRRMIVGLIVFAGLFAIIGNELRLAQGKTKQGAGGFVTEPARIFVGVTAGGTLLLLLSRAGKPGEELASGLAVLTFASSALVFGGPVWSWLAGLFSSAPGGRSTGPTSPTMATSSTGQPAPLALPPVSTPAPNKYLAQAGA